MIRAFGTKETERHSNDSGSHDSWRVCFRWENGDDRTHSFPRHRNHRSSCDTASPGRPKIGGHVIQLPTAIAWAEPGGQLIDPDVHVYVGKNSMV